MCDYWQLILIRQLDTWSITLSHASYLRVWLEQEPGLAATPWMLSLTPRLTKTITHCPLLLSISLLLNCLLLSISLLLNCFHCNNINSNSSLVVEQPLSIRSCLQWWGQHTVVTLILSIYIKLGVLLLLLLLLLSVPLTISFCLLPFASFQQNFKQTKYLG